MEDEGLHFAHLGNLRFPCSYHIGTCEEVGTDPSLWCPCGRENRGEVKHDE